MLNSTKKIVVFIIFLSTLIINNDVYGDCNRATCNYISDPSFATTSWQTVSNSVPNGTTYNRYDFYLTSGRTYEFSLCAADGGSANYDSYLCLYGYGYGCYGSSSFLAYNDDACGSASKITYTASQSGWTSLYVSDYSTSYGSYTLAYRYTMSCGDINHFGNDWIISSDQIVQGNHHNIGTFTVDSGVTVTVDPNCHYFYVKAENINVLGTINADGTRITYFTVSDCPDDSDFLAYAANYVLKDDRMIRFKISDDGKSCFYEARKEVTEDMLVDLLNEAYYDFYNNAQNSLNDNDSNPIKSFKKSNYDGKSYRVAFKLEDTPNLDNVKSATILLKEKGNFEDIFINDNIHFELSSKEPISADFVIEIFEEFGLKIEEEFILEN